VAHRLLSHRHIRNTTRKMKERKAFREKRRTTSNCLTNLLLPLDPESLKPTGNRGIHGTVGKSERGRWNKTRTLWWFGSVWEKGDEEKRFELEADGVNGTINTKNTVPSTWEKKIEMEKSFCCCSFSRKLQGISASKININCEDYSSRAGNDLNREIMTGTLIIRPRKISLTGESYNEID